MTTEIESAYTEKPITERAYDPLHASVKELISQYSKTGGVLDLGCSDGVATWGMDGLNVYGLDFNKSALRQAGENQPGYRGVYGDIKRLPFTPESLDETDTVLLLDVLEHEKWDDSVAILRDLKDLLPANHTLIISMPIVSPMAVDSWREGLQVVKNGARPSTGLFDATHKILTNRKGHLKLLQEGGYTVVEEHQTNRIEGTTDDWKWKTNANSPYSRVERLQRTDMLGNRHSTLQSKAAAVAIAFYNRTQDSSVPFVQQAGRNMFAYQGLYVAQPNPVGV